jgi:hypothetical protein
MLTIDLEPELETLLNKIAQRADCSPNELIKQLISHYLEQQASELLTNIINELPIFPSFANQDPLILQSALRDEWH